MIALSRVIERFEADYLAQCQPLPSQRQALAAFKRCRTALAATFTARCSNEQCQALRVVPHSCGHRLCPHCQHFDSQRWIERQRRQLVPGAYFLVT
ncbi:MAG: transposase zinc-binding domain-containing protein, partial [Betaproteobacteria bacterium]|nr:transposase zinc-binding domain-containing protein [Betaproteobacteria bacterium]